MTMQKLTLSKNSDVLLARKAVEKLLDCREEAALRLYLYLAQSDGAFDAKTAAARLSVGIDAISGALDLLTKLGLVQKESAPVLERADTMPEYTVGDVTDVLARDDSFRYLLEFTQQRLGKVLSTVDTQTLLGIYSWMGLPVDVICLIVTCCVDEIRAKYGEGRRPTMRNIENRARLWLNLGILTTAQAEEYLNEQQKRGTRIASLSRLLHLSGRALSPTENRYLTAWVDANFSDEMILEAYDLTVVKTGGLKWKYMDSILKSWQSKGYQSQKDIIRGERIRKELQEGECASVSQEELESMQRLRELNREWGSEKNGI